MLKKLAEKAVEKMTELVDRAARARLTDQATRLAEQLWGEQTPEGYRFDLVIEPGGASPVSRNHAQDFRIALWHDGGFLMCGNVLPDIGGDRLLQEERSKGLHHAGEPSDLVHMEGWVKLLGELVEAQDDIGRPYWVPRDGYRIRAIRSSDVFCGARRRFDAGLTELNESMEHHGVRASTMADILGSNTKKVDIRALVAAAQILQDAGDSAPGMVKVMSTASLFNELDLDDPLQEASMDLRDAYSSRRPNAAPAAKRN